MSDHVKVRMNPNFKADMMKAAEEKLGGKIGTEKELLQALDRGERLSNSLLAELSRRGLIMVSDVTHMQSPPGVRELLFISLTERGQQVLMG